MSLHINRFVDRLKAADARNQRDFTMSVVDARDLHADITKLLLVIKNLQDRPSADDNNEVIQVEVNGGSF